MTVPIRPLPPESDHAWYLHYQDIDLAVRELQTLVEALSPPAGFISSINGTLTPDVSGNVVITAVDVDAMSSGYMPSVTDMPAVVPCYADKDPATGWWPTGWNADGTAQYVLGAVDQGVRPHTRRTPVIWRGAEPSPARVVSGAGGMLAGLDERAINVP